MLSSCLFGIGIETGSTYPCAWYTEKTYNIITGGLIPVIIGGAGAMGQLENMGFIIPDFLNWKLYDLWPIDQAGTGVDKIKLIVENLHDFTQKNNMQEIADYWYPCAVKNYDYFFNDFKKKCLEEEKIICKWILTITHNISNPKYQNLFV